MRPALATTLAALALAGCGSSPSRGLVLVGATVVSGPEATALPDAFVVIEGDRIHAVGPQARVSVPKGLPIVDVRGKFILPLAAARRAEAPGRPPGSDPVAVLAAALKGAGPGGVLAAGSDADLLILDQDPRTDLAHLAAVHAVVRGGRMEAPRQPS